MKKMGFFKKIWYSIDKVDKYSELAEEGVKKALKYISLLVLILAIIAGGAYIVRTTSAIKEISKYIEEKTPDFTYSNGVLDIKSDEIIKDTDNEFGKIIVDTKTEDEEQIKKYIEEINNEDNAIIILKSELKIKQTGIQGLINYNYNELLENTGMTELNKQDIVNYLRSSKMITMYLNLFIVLVAYSFVIYFINTMFYVVIISVFGYLTAIILKLKLRFSAIFSMAIYSITLPTLLYMIYIGVNAFFTYNINYFDIMYVLIAAIYMIAAIFILKTEFNKTQGEVQKIVEVEEQIKEEKNKEENKKTDKENNKEQKRKDKEDNKKDDVSKPNNLGEQGEIGKQGEA